MKKIILSGIFFMAFLGASNAQFELEKLFACGTFGYAKPLGDFSEFAKGGLTYTGEVGYELTENLSVGVGYTYAATLAIDSTGDSGIFGINVYSLPSYFAKGWYTFTEGKVRPYAGLGLGISRSGLPDVTINNQLIVGKKRTGFGGHLELGVLFGGFNLSYAFNLNSKTPKELEYNPKVQDLSVMYHRFNIGYRYSF